MGNNKEIVLRKIPLKVLLDVLNTAWNNGADFIDIIGVPNEIQDNIGIVIRKEYMVEIPDEEGAVQQEDDEEDKELNDDNIIDLI